MDAAVLTEVGAPPQFGEFDDPTGGDGLVVVNMAAAGVHHMDLAKASADFYLGPPAVPSVLGSDGVGRLTDGRRVFFDAPVPPFGTWAQRCLVLERSLLELADGVDDAVAAALGNTGLSAWLALEWRARLQPGETVLVLGATGALGSIAVQVAKILGAAHVVAVDREESRLQNLPGADAIVVLRNTGDLAAEFKDATKGGADVVIDPLWGDPALSAMQSANHGARHVQIGQMAAPTMDFPASVIRGKSIDLLGFAHVTAPGQTRRAAYRRLTAHAAAGDITVNLERVPLHDVGACWQRQKEGPGTKLVLMPECRAAEITATAVEGG